MSFLHCSEVHHGSSKNSFAFLIFSLLHGKFATSFRRLSMFLGLIRLFPNRGIRVILRYIDVKKMMKSPQF